MKLNLKRTIIFFLLCLLTTILSCTNEREFIENGNSQKLKAYQKNFKDLMLLKNFSTAYNKVLSEKSKNLVSRSAIEEEYKFTIAEDVPIKVFEYNSKLFYNILIFKDSVNSEVLENLVLKVENIENQEEVSAYIIKYGLTNAELTDEKEIVNLFGRFSQFCSYACSPMCTTTGTSEGTTYSSPHPMSSGECTFSYWGNCTMDCVTGGGGGFGGPNSNGYGDDGAGSDGSTGGSGGGSATPQDTTATPNNDGAGSGNEVNELIVAPVDDEEERYVNPCKKIKAQNNKFTSLKAALVNLNTKTSELIENGLFIDASATATNQNIQNVPPGVNGQLDINFNPPSKYTIFAHTHNSPNSSTYSIFSWEDLLTLSTLINTDKIKINDFIFYVLTADGTRYAITLNNVTKFTNFFFNLGPLTEGTNIEEKMNQLNKMENFHYKYYNFTDNPNCKIRVNSLPDNDKLNFLKLIKEADLGIDLFEVDASFTVYTKLELDDNNNIIPSPCNN